MKKNAHKEEKCPDLPDESPQKRAPENFLVFIILAIILLAISIFFNQRPYFLRMFASAPAETDGAEKYVWLTGSPDIPEGLYLFTEEQLQKDFPEVFSLPTGESVPESLPLVSAVRITGDSPRKIKLPPDVANIFFQPISINRAEKEILTSLPGIGPVLAEKIVQHRDQHGPYRTKDELLHISGIGPKKYAALVNRITVE